jgi:hypothetical protein
LVFQYGTLIADLEHWQYDTFRAIWRQRRLGQVYLTFTLDETGQVDELRALDLATFKREPDSTARAAGGR